jgi:hypothetical protein
MRMVGKGYGTMCVALMHMYPALTTQQLPRVALERLIGVFLLSFFAPERSIRPNASCNLLSGIRLLHLY